MPSSHSTRITLFVAIGVGTVLLVIFLAARSEIALGQDEAIATPSAAEMTTTRPNIILILTDDEDTGMTAYMPNLQALIVQQGLSFTRFFHNDALCCPARASILRGQTTDNTRIFENHPSIGGFQTFYSRGEEQSTVATWLQSAGYRTALMGKYLNGYPQTAPSNRYVPPGWSEWYVATSNAFNAQFNYTLNENGTLVTYGSSAADYGTDVLARKADDFIRRAAAQGQPFFLYIAPVAPHGSIDPDPPVPAPRHNQLFPGAQAPRLPHFNEADVSDKPAYVRNTPLLSEQRIAEVDLWYRRRLQSMQAVDEMIALLIGTLQQTGQLGNTYIFYTSDNGYSLGQHRLFIGKRAPYEEVIRVPLYVRGPGVPAGATRDHMVANIDLAPTFAALAGVIPPTFVDGRSLVPLLGFSPPSSAAWRQALLIAHGPPPATPATPIPSSDYPVPNFRGLRG
ncbi:MAG: sulfatase, partial [Anaerolineae bacterium]|nr:sulfatase [Caldilineales bacterium]MDW8268881.1 sulfatase [Anaerolineae bacterium]